MEFVPTMRLRILVTSNYACGEAGGAPAERIKTLQQWWLNPGHLQHHLPFSDTEGEWRDVEVVEA